METLEASLEETPSESCVRTIVVWKRFGNSFNSLLVMLRENHSGMETE